MRTFYHITPAQNLAGIMETGLVPQLGERSLMQGEEIPAVFLFEELNTVQDALLAWFLEYFPESAELALLRVTPEVDSIVESLAQYEVMVYGTIKPNLITVIPSDVLGHRVPS